MSNGLIRAANQRDRAQDHFLLEEVGLPEFAVDKNGPGTPAQHR